jgi:hypothetical protein
MNCEFKYGGRRNGKTRELMIEAIDKAMAQYKILFITATPFRHVVEFSKIIEARKVPFARYGKKYGIQIRFRDSGYINVFGYMK